MEAEPDATTGAEGPEDTAALPEVAEAPARRPRLKTFTRLARFSPHTRRWHSIDPASRERGDGTGNEVSRGSR